MPQTAGRNGINTRGINPHKKVDSHRNICWNIYLKFGNGCPRPAPNPPSVHKGARRRSQVQSPPFQPLGANCFIGLRGKRFGSGGPFTRAGADNSSPPTAPRMT